MMLTPTVTSLTSLFWLRKITRLVAMSYMKKLKSHGILSRRYFYPLISNMPMYRCLPSSDLAHLPQANILTKKVLCLPIYADLDKDSLDIIVKLIAGETLK